MKSKLLNRFPVLEVKLLITSKFKVMALLAFVFFGILIVAGSANNSTVIYHDNFSRNLSGLLNLILFTVLLAFLMKPTETFRFFTLLFNAF